MRCLPKAGTGENMREPVHGASSPANKGHRSAHRTPGLKMSQLGMCGLGERKKRQAIGSS